MSLSQKRRTAALNKELLAVERQEHKMQKAALKAHPAVWKTELERHVPQKVYTGLERAFAKGFGIVFLHGHTIIERSFDREDIRADFEIRDYAVHRKGGRKELKQIRRGAQRMDMINMAVTAVEGIGLGALGIGMPDVVLFLGNLLKGIYETALNYGFDYHSRQEQLRILKMMQTALSSGETWVQRNAEVNKMLELETVDITDDVFHQQVNNTASTFAMEMLLLKFIQGMPIVGIVGGAANPIYYNKVMKYVQLKYRKRYLVNQKGGMVVVDT